MATKSSSAQPAPAAASVIEVQHQIRANAAQLQDYFSDLYSWEKSVSQEEETRKKARASSAAAASATATPAPRVRQTVNVTTAQSPSTFGVAVDAATSKKHVEPAAHTYDKGYNKWAKFDVEKALREADEGQALKSSVHKSKTGRTPLTPTASSTASTAKVKTETTVTEKLALPKKGREDLEREEGNAHYQRGDYVAAIKCYTRCLGYNPKNAVVLSNRAMAYLKNREFSKAEDDCNLALKIDPNHLKSLSRRATARNALGKHRLALLDFERASELDPKSRQLQIQIVSTKELIRMAIKRAPRRTQFSIEVIGSAHSEPTQTSKLVSEKHTRIEIEEEQNENADGKENTAGNSVVATIPAAQKRNVLSDKSVTASSQSVPLSLPKTANTAPPNSAPQAVASVPARNSTLSISPKLPKKAPTSSYEFARVWKTLALKGDNEKRHQLLTLRAEYLQLIQPSQLATIFKNSIEPDILCEAFHVFRHAILSAGNGCGEEETRFVAEFASQLAKVPRFSMVVMFLSTREKEDIIWVVEHLQLKTEAGDQNQLKEVETLKKLYELS